ncbi:MAG: class I tRNA ligase family protein, partial [Victivallales bacterium]|nr:class I tRNA ligase family protein [Victivallales bacterium]
LFDYCVATFLKLLHPIMPFVTDELYHQMGFATADDSIMKTEWPAAIPEDVLNGYGATQAAEDDAEAKFELIRAIRAVRANYGIATSKALDMVVAPANDEMHEFLKRDEASFKALVNAGELKFVPGYQPEGPSGVAVSTAATAYIPLAGIVDLDAEKKRLEKQEAELAKYVGVVEKKLSNEKFVSKAPADVVAQERAKLAEAQEKLARVREQMKAY